MVVWVFSHSHKPPSLYSIPLSSHSMYVHSMQFYALFPPSSVHQQVRDHTPQVTLQYEPVHSDWVCQVGWTGPAHCIISVSRSSSHSLVIQHIRAQHKPYIFKVRMVCRNIATYNDMIMSYVTGSDLFCSQSQAGGCSHRQSGPHCQVVDSILSSPPSSLSLQSCRWGGGCGHCRTSTAPFISGSRPGQWNISPDSATESLISLVTVCVGHQRTLPPSDHFCQVRLHPATARLWLLPPLPPPSPHSLPHCLLQ